MTRNRTPTSKATASKAAKQGVRRCTKCPNRPLRSECAHTKLGLEFLAKAASNLQNQLVTPAQERGTSRSDDEMTSSPDLPATPSPAGPGVIDPFLLAQSHPIGTALPEFPTPGPETPSVKTKKRIRPSASNNVHGRVEGAKRGNQVYEVVRTKALREPIKDSRAAGKRFHRLLTSLVTRCERLSHETGCWLYLGAQHASATTEYTHYASTRLRREAMPQLADIHQQFNKAMAALVSSRRRDAVDMAMQLAQAQEEQMGALAEAEASRRALQQEQSSGAQKDVEIGQLQALLGIRGASLV